MSLEGSLASFGLPDVLSLLAMTAKTGQLRLHRSEDSLDGSVVLKDGVVVAAAADDADNTLARRFIAAGLINQSELEQALSGGEPLAEGLALAADLDPAAIAGLAGEQVLDAVFDLLRWPEGDFAFDVCEVAQARTHTEVAVTVVIAEAQRRLTSLPELADRLPDPSTVFALPVSAAEQRPSSAEEWAAMALVDGRRTLGEAVGMSDRGSWQTLTVFAGLIERGLLVEAGDRRSAAYRSSLMSMVGAPVPAGGYPEAAASAAPSATVSPFAVPAAAPVAVAPAVEPAAAETAAAAEPAAAAVEPDEGIDDALLQQLMAGARAL